MYELEPPASGPAPKCPKCGHQRQAAEQAPEWQCPGCGVAYAKVRATQPAARRARPANTRARHAASRLPWLSGLSLVFLATIVFWAPSASSTRVHSLQEADIIMFATPTCPYCAEAREFFAENNVAYFEYDLTTSTEGRRRFAALGGQGVPLFLIGSQRISGFSEYRLRAVLRSRGAL